MRGGEGSCIFLLGMLQQLILQHRGKSLTILKNCKKTLDQICKLKDIRQGSVVKQYFEVMRKDGTMSCQ